MTTQNFLFSSPDPATEQACYESTMADVYAEADAALWGCSPEEANKVSRRAYASRCRFPVVAADPAPCTPDCIPF